MSTARSRSGGPETRWRPTPSIPTTPPAWYVNIKAVEWKTPRPLSVGSQIAFVATFLGRRIA